MSGIIGSAITTASDSSKGTPAAEADEVTWLLEAARRATWSAKHVPAYLRSGCFFIAAHLDAHASSRLG